MPTPYSFDKDTLDHARLSEEILASSITSVATEFLGMEDSGVASPALNLVITFENALSGPDEATLNTVVANHPSGTLPPSDSEPRLLGTWDANTNTPALASGVGVIGDTYVVSAAGTTNLDGTTDWEAQDWAYFDGTVWLKLDHTDKVASVNTQTGTVILGAGDVGADPSGTAASAVSTHEGLADPHSVYQLGAEKDQANGYAGLDGSGLVPDARIAATIARDSEVAFAVAQHEGLGDPHPVYQTEAEVDGQIATHTGVADAHHARPVQATEGELGIAELATQGEVNTGTDDLRIVTPLKLATFLNSNASDLIVVQARRTTTLDNVPTAWTDLSFDATDVQNDTSVIEHNGGDQIQVKETGLYEITYLLTCDDEIQGRVRINDTTVIPGSTQQSGDPTDVNQIIAALTTKVYAQLTANDFLTVQVQAATTAENIQVGALFLVKQLRGQKGAKGDTGSGSNITLQDDGVNVANTPHDTIDFGSGINVADNADGSATVSIANVYGSEYHYDEKTTSQSSTASIPGSPDEYFTTTTPVLEGGNYEIHVNVQLEPNATNNSYGWRVQVDNSINVSNPGGNGFIVEEGKDAGSAQRQPRSCFRRVALGAGTHTIDIDFGRASSGTVVFYYAAISLVRVP